MQPIGTRPRARASNAPALKPKFSLLGILALSALPSCSQGGAEPNLEGELKTYVVDHADGTHRTGYALKTGPTSYVELDFAQTPELAPGTFLAVSGKASSFTSVDGAFASADVFGVEAVQVMPAAARVATLAQPLVGSATTAVKVAVVLLNFQGVTAQSFSLADANERLATLRGYYQEISYGMWDPQGDAFGPFEIEKPANCNLDTISNAGRQAAIAHGVAIDDYAHVGFTLPSNDASGLDCACGLAWVGRSQAQPNPEVAETSLYTCTDTNAFTHEMGHGFGFSHASTASCGGQPYQRSPYESCGIEEYGNQFNTMGNGLGHMNAFQKSSMKWLDECNTVLVTRDATFDVYAMQAASDGVQALQIPNGDSRDGKDLFYYVEYRNPALGDFNAGPSGEPREKGSGVHIDVAADFRNDSGDRRPLLLGVNPDSPGTFGDPRLLPGQSFVDPDQRVTVHVLATSAEKATIEVTFPDGGSGANHCIDGSSPPASGPPAAATLFQHCAYGGWAVTLEPGEYTTAELALLGAVDDDASSLALGEGYQAELFDGDDFTGTSLALSTKSDCLVDQAFNDMLSSIRIIAPSDGSAGAGGSDDGGAGGSAGNASSAGTGGVVSTAGGSAGTAAGQSATAGAAPAALQPTARANAQPRPPLDAGCACRSGAPTSMNASLAPAFVAALFAIGAVRARRRRASYARRADVAA